MWIDKTKLKREIVKAMRLATPKDTGNLAYNAMSSKIQGDKIIVEYDGHRAPYGKILNQTIYRKVVTGNHVRYKRNKHFGWNNRAQMNGMKVVMQSLGHRKVKMFDTKQNYRYPINTKQSVAARNQQYQKTLNNSAIKEYERINKV